MLVNTMQHQILPEAQANQYMWVATVNWCVTYGENVEIDSFQENANKDIKSVITSLKQTSLKKQSTEQAKLPKE